jgi:hypothetical protein
MLGLQIPDKLLSLGPILQAWANTVGRRSRAWVVGSNLRAAISHHAKIDFADQTRLCVPQGCHLEGKPRPLVGMAEDPGRVAASRCQRVKVLTDRRAEAKLRGELAQVAGVGEGGRTD